MECFVSVLQEDVKQVLKLLSPNNVEGAFKRARYCAQGSNALQGRKSSWKRPGRSSNSIVGKEKISQMQEVITLCSGGLSRETSEISQEQGKVEGTSNLKLDKEGVKCSQSGRKSTEHVMEEKNSDFAHVEVQQGMVTDEVKEEIQKPQSSMEVSVHAIEGVYSNQTITLTGRRGQKEFTILMDGGSHTVFWMRKLLLSLSVR